MESTKINLRSGVLLGLILLAAISRMLPHLHNFSPLGAISLFGAAYFSRKWQAILVPLVATFCSDLYLNNVVYAAYFPRFTWFSFGLYWPFSSFFTYAAYAATALIGFSLFRKVTAGRVVAGAVLSIVIFFVFTNFASWPNNPLYPQNATGLAACFAAGLPFIKGTVLGTALYTPLLFGSFALLQKQYPALQRPYRLAA
jgi:hypothetical protein